MSFFVEWLTDHTNGPNWWYTGLSLEKSILYVFTKKSYLSTMNSSQIADKLKLSQNRLPAFQFKLVASLWKVILKATHRWRHSQRIARKVWKKLQRATQWNIIFSFYIKVVLNCYRINENKNWIFKTYKNTNKNPRESLII